MKPILITREATYSGDMKYRSLLRINHFFPASKVYPAGPIPVGEGRINWLMLNPSTATEAENDPTITRCIQRSLDWGFHEVSVTNLFAYRATDPREMMAEKNPVSHDVSPGHWSENDATIIRIARLSDAVILAWGEHGKHLNRSQQVLSSLLCHGHLHKCYYLALTKSGEPRHPLYLKRILTPKPWSDQVRHPAVEALAA